MILETAYNPIFLFLFGACWGSFLNVVFYRVPQSKSVVLPQSACPTCDRPIAFYDNVPIFSWLLLRGKCRHCRAPISIKYPIVEALGGLAFFVPWWIHPESPPRGLVLGVAILSLGASIHLYAICRRVPAFLILAALTACATYFWFAVGAMSAP